ncbi:MAG: O-antigen ligase family protein, partial [Lentisphaeraceae bacterium]|nr:O-antigen ligase family protein [Lentisphaeraceae bacterium]
MTISRGSIAFSVLSLAGVFVILVLKSQKMPLLPYVLASCILLPLMAYIAYDTVAKRYEESPSVQLNLRGQYNTDAKLMAKEHFWGVGAGNFSAWSILKYADMNPDRTEIKGTPAHSMWYLALGELGYPGLTILILLWLRFYYITLKVILKKIDFYHFSWLIGAAMGCMGMLINESLNNVYRESSVYYMILLMSAIPVAITYLQEEQQTLDLQEIPTKSLASLSD